MWMIYEANENNALVPQKLISAYVRKYMLHSWQIMKLFHYFCRKIICYARYKPIKDIIGREKENQ